MMKVYRVLAICLSIAAPLAVFGFNSCLNNLGVCPSTSSPSSSQQQQQQQEFWSASNSQPRKGAFGLYSSNTDFTSYGFANNAGDNYDAGMRPGQQQQQQPSYGATSSSSSSDLPFFRRTIGPVARPYSSAADESGTQQQQQQPPPATDEVRQPPPVYERNNLLNNEYIGSMRASTMAPDTSYDAVSPRENDDMTNKDSANAGEELVSQTEMTEEMTAGGLPEKSYKPKMTSLSDEEPIGSSSLSSIDSTESNKVSLKSGNYLSSLAPKKTSNSEGDNASKSEKDVTSGSSPGSSSPTTSPKGASLNEGTTEWVPTLSSKFGRTASFGNKLVPNDKGNRPKPVMIEQTADDSAPTSDDSNSPATSRTSSTMDKDKAARKENVKLRTSVRSAFSRDSGYVGSRPTPSAPRTTVAPASPLEVIAKERSSKGQVNRKRASQPAANLRPLSDPNPTTNDISPSDKTKGIPVSGSGSSAASLTDLSVEGKERNDVESSPMRGRGYLSSFPPSASRKVAPAIPEEAPVSSVENDYMSSLSRYMSSLSTKSSASKESVAETIPVSGSSTDNLIGQSVGGKDKVEDKSTTESAFLDFSGPRSSSSTAPHTFAPAPPLEVTVTEKSPPSTGQVDGKDFMNSLSAYMSSLSPKPSVSKESVSEVNPVSDSSSSPGNLSNESTAEGKKGKPKTKTQSKSAVSSDAGYLSSLASSAPPTVAPAPPLEVIGKDESFPNSDQVKSKEASKPAANFSSLSDPKPITKDSSPLDKVIAIDGKDYMSSLSTMDSTSEESKASGSSTDSHTGESEKDLAKYINPEDRTISPSFVGTFSDKKPESSDATIEASSNMGTMLKSNSPEEQSTLDSVIPVSEAEEETRSSLSNDMNYLNTPKTSSSSNIAESTPSKSSDYLNSLSTSKPFDSDASSEVPTTEYVNTLSQSTTAPNYNPQPPNFPPPVKLFEEQEQTASLEEIDAVPFFVTEVNKVETSTESLVEEMMDELSSILTESESSEGKDWLEGVVDDLSGLLPKNETDTSSTPLLEDIASTVSKGKAWFEGIVDDLKGLLPKEAPTIDVPEEEENNEPELDTTGMTERIMKKTSKEAQARGAGGSSTWDAFQRAEKNWSKLKDFQPFTYDIKHLQREQNGIMPPPQFVTDDGATGNPKCWSKLREQEDKKLDYDIVVCGGTLGIFFAMALLLKGHTVCVLEAGKLLGREQEWNISMDELLELMDIGVLTEEDINAAIQTEFPGCRSGFKNREVTPLPGGYFQNGVGFECETPDVLNLGISPSVLIERVASRFKELGGSIKDKTSLQGVAVSNSIGTALDIGQGEDPITASLVIDCMGNASPISRQQRYGTKPDGVCAVVGSCAAGYDKESNVMGDIIYTNNMIQDKGENGKLQYFWEAFPVGIGRNGNEPGSSDVKTTYMFTYMDADEMRPSLEMLMEDYWKLLPNYQKSIRNPETDLDVKRVLFAFFPTYRDSPLTPQWSRVLAVGDASGIQSPLSFGGFGALTRHLERITGAISEAIENGCLHKDDLAEINAYTPNLSAAWMFQKAMSVRMGQEVDPKFVNRLLATNFEGMDNMGQRTIKPFLQDVVRFDGLVGSLARSFLADPTFMPEIVKHVGLPTLIEWLGHVGMMGTYSLLDNVASPAANIFVEKEENPRKKFQWRRRMEAWKFGSGNDYELPETN